MSCTSLLDIKLAGEPRDILEILEILLDHGWSVNDHGHITYLPVGDNNMFEWQQAPLASWPEVQMILQEKADKGETPGVVLTWQNTAVGGDFHFDIAGRSLSAGWSINRKTIKGGFTDHSWYLSKVLSPLSDRNVRVESFRCIDSL